LSRGFKRERPISRFDVPIGATCDAVGISQSTYFDWLQKSPEFSEATTRARGQARATLIEKIRLSNDWRAHAWLLSHCWPQEFSESRILTGAPDGKPKQFDVAFLANSDKPMSELLETFRCAAHIATASSEA
jgi:hypothetical protein